MNMPKLATKSSQLLTLSDVPTSINASSSSALNITVSSANNDLAFYKYKIGSSSLDCADYNGYSPPIAGSVAITDDVAGFASNSSVANAKICVVKINSSGLQQSFSEATSASWIVDTEAPTATLFGAPSGTDINTILNITVSATIPSDIATYKYKVGASASTDCAVSSGYSNSFSASTHITANISSIADGSVKICVLGLDTALNEQVTATSATWTKDTSAPVAVLSNVPTSLSSSTGATLNIAVTATDPSAIVSYRYKYGNASLDCSDPNAYTGDKLLSVYPNITDSVSSFASDSNVANTKICVLAKNSYGYEQAPANATSATWITDLSASPAILTGAPTGTNNTTTLNISVSAVNSSDIVQYKYKVGETSNIDCSSDTSYSSATAIANHISTSLSTLIDGAITLCVVAIDNRGNQQSYASATTASWTKDTTGPTATLSGYSSVYNSSSSFSIAVSAVVPSDIVSYRYKIVIASIDCIDPSGYSNVTAKAMAIADSIVLFSSNTTSNNTKLCVVGLDIHNNQQAFATATSVSWITDTTVPVAALTGAPKGESNSTSLSISVGAVVSGDIVSYKYKIGYYENIDCTSEAGYSSIRLSGTAITNDLSTLDDAAIKLCVIAKDYAGNEQTYANATKAVWALQRSKIAANQFGTCSINRDGVLRCWGNDYSSSLGSGSSGSYLQTPKIIDSGVSYKEIALSAMHGCGITTDGVLKCWGYNGYYQVHSGSTATQQTPIEVDSGSSYSKVTVGAYHTCGITTSGVLKCWGYNGNGQVGNTTANSPVATPYIVNSGTAYSAVKAGSDHTCAITTTGVLKCWGYNGNGQIRTGSFSNVLTPTIINDGTTYSSLGLAVDHTCAITTAGVLQCWQYNGAGILGDGLQNSRSVLATINSGTTFINVAENASNLYDVNYYYVNNACAISTEGALKCWGNNNSGQVGDGTYDQRLSPVDVDSSVKYSTVANGVNHSCAITRKGETKCWGSNSNYQLGNSTSSTSLTPILTTSAITIADIPTGTTTTNTFNVNPATDIDTETTVYKYKLGTNTMSCSDSNGYLPYSPTTQDIATNISESLASIADGYVQLCILPVNFLGHTPPYYTAKSYNWTKLVAGSLTVDGDTYESSATRSFGPVYSGATPTTTITLKNIGGGNITDITPTGITPTGITDSSFPFSFEGGGNYPGSNGDCGRTLAPGASCRMNVTFSPDASDNYLGFSSTLNLSYNNGASSPTLPIYLSGTTRYDGCTDSNAQNYDSVANYTTGCSYDCDTTGAYNYHVKDGGACGFCSSGESWNGSSCVSNCSGSDVWNPNSSQCVSTSCSSPYIWDNSTYSCQQPSCSSGTYWFGSSCVSNCTGSDVWNPNSGQCVSSMCWSPYSWNSSSYSCQPPSCQSSEVWNPNSSQCVSTSCSGGEDWDSGSYVCRSRCQSYEVWNPNSSQCVSTSCSSPYIWDSSTYSCQPPSCSDGTYWDGSSCVSNCPDGSWWDGNSCQ